MIKKITIILIVLALHVACNNLNAINKDGYMNFHGRTERYFYFYTRDDAEAILRMITQTYGKFNLVVNTEIQKEYVWDDLVINNSHFKMNVFVSKTYKEVDEREVFDYYSIDFIIIDANNSNILDLPGSENIVNRFQGLINSLE